MFEFERDLSKSEANSELGQISSHLYEMDCLISLPNLTNDEKIFILDHILIQSSGYCSFFEGTISNSAQCLFQTVVTEENRDKLSKKFLKFLEKMRKEKILEYGFFNIEKDRYQARYLSIYNREEFKPYIKKYGKDE